MAKDAQESAGFTLFNGNKVRSLGLGAVLAVFIINQGTDLAFKIVDKIHPETQQVALANSSSPEIIASLNAVKSEVSGVKTALSSSESRMNPYVERLTNALETLTTLQQKMMLDDKVRSQKLDAILDNQATKADIDALKKKLPQK